MMPLKYFVEVYDYDRDLHRTVIINREKFRTEEEALKYADSVELGFDTKVIVSGNYGYNRIKTITRYSKQFND